MNTLVIVLIAAVVLVCAYAGYGRWLAKTWGVDPNAKTPAVRLEDGKDYVPTNGWTVFAHQFSSIAGAGPVTGAIQAAAFGWLPVLLWVLIGGVFFGAVTDFGALYASVKNDGKSMGLLIEKYIGKTGRKLFLLFCWLFCGIVIAAFADMVAGTFNAFDADGAQVEAAFTNGSAGMVSIMFMVFAVIFGLIQKKFNFSGWKEAVVGIAFIVLSFVVGMNCPIILGKAAWSYITFIYIFFAAVLPMWLLKQPRDYMTTFMFGAMIAGAIVGLLVAHPTMNLPVFTGFNNEKLGTMFPILFVTVACGAVSGFHSLIGSGTTSKQLDSEKDAKVIGYGAMIVESALAVIALIAIGVVFKETNIGGGEKFLLTAPPTIFAGGVATMVATTFGGVADFSNPVYDTTYTLLTLAVSVFALTSLDSGTRLARYMFAELFVPEGKTREELTGARKFFSNPFVATLIMVVIGCGMGFMGLNQIWGVFGAANQLLAGIAMLAVASWLGQVGKSNKMFFVPMVFMLAATGTSLTMTIIAKIKLIAGLVADKTAAWGDWFQMIWSVGLIVLAVILVVEGVQVLAKPKAKKA